MDFNTWEDVARLPLENSGIFNKIYSWSLYSLPDGDKLLALNLHQRATKLKSKKRVEEFLTEYNKELLKHYDIKDTSILYIDTSRDALLIRLVNHVIEPQQKKRVKFGKPSTAK
jgi:hypothetical protein